MPIAGLLRREVGADKIAAKLGKYRTRHMDLEPDPEADLRAAERLKEWFEWRFHNPEYAELHWPYERPSQPDLEEVDG